MSVYSFLMIFALVIYAVENFVNIDFSLLPYLYVIADIIVTLDYDHVHAYDISCLVSQQQKYHSSVGFVAVDLKRRFLSCNEQAFNFFPELRNQRVDSRFLPDSGFQGIFYDLIDSFEDDDSVTSMDFSTGEKVLKCEISTFALRKNAKPQGYLINIRDFTQEKRNLEIINQNAEKFEKEVKEKTENISNIQEKVVLGLANIVENRDNITGGHIKRTSDVIKILLQEVKKQKIYDIDDEKIRDIVRAAPMHDLGKLYIDVDILTKPGKLTDEEFEIMKTHATQSGEIVQLILQDVEEPHFVKTAYNVARFHHEKWNGRGYPENLVGEMIPLEARIMAVADVYDALVSPRHYKPALPFDKAASIIVNDTGSHFAPELLPVFLACREDLEAYYRKANGDE